jgi:hypothetical protein
MQSVVDAGSVKPSQAGLGSRRSLLLSSFAEDSVPFQCFLILISFELFSRSTHLALSRVSRDSMTREARSLVSLLSLLPNSAPLKPPSIHLYTINMGSSDKPEIITAYDKSSFLAPQEQSLPGLDADMTPKAEHTKVSLIDSHGMRACSDSSPKSLYLPPITRCPFAERSNSHSLPLASPSTDRALDSRGRALP